MAGKNFWVICIDYQPKIYEGPWGKSIQDKTKGSQFYRGFTSRADAEAAFLKTYCTKLEQSKLSGPLAPQA